MAAAPPRPFFTKLHLSASTSACRSIFRARGRSGDLDAPALRHPRRVVVSSEAKIALGHAPFVISTPLDRVSSSRCAGQLLTHHSFRASSARPSIRLHSPANRAEEHGEMLDVVLRSRSGGMSNRATFSRCRDLAEQPAAPSGQVTVGRRDNAYVDPQGARPPAARPCSCSAQDIRLRVRAHAPIRPEQRAPSPGRTVRCCLSHRDAPVRVRKFGIESVSAAQRSSP